MDVALRPCTLSLLGLRFQGTRAYGILEGLKERQHSVAFLLVGGSFVLLRDMQKTCGGGKGGRARLSAKPLDLNPPPGFGFSLLSFSPFRIDEALV